MKYNKTNENISTAKVSSIHISTLTGFKFYFVLLYFISYVLYIFAYPLLDRGCFIWHLFGFSNVFAMPHLFLLRLTSVESIRPAFEILSSFSPAPLL